MIKSPSRESITALVRAGTDIENRFHEAKQLPSDLDPSVLQRFCKASPHNAQIQMAHNSHLFSPDVPREIWAISKDFRFAQCNRGRCSLLPPVGVLNFESERSFLFLFYILQILLTPSSSSRRIRQLPQTIYRLFEKSVHVTPSASDFPLKICLGFSPITRQSHHPL